MIITEEEAKQYPFILPRNEWYGATEIPPGWHDIIMAMCQEIKVFLYRMHIPIEKYHCNQGKEKWGHLEWYDSFDDDVENSMVIRLYMRDSIIQHYKHILDYVCTQCGKPGIMRNKEWVEPLCDNCFKSEDIIR